MATFPEKYAFDLIEKTGAPGTWIVQTTPVVDISQWSVKAFSYKQGVGKTFVGALQGSVSGDVWDTVDAFGAETQGLFGEAYKYVRVNITVEGAAGTGTRIVIAGKVL